ncbi:MAG: hypothetical protein CO186_06095 [Zetaproteobacteria bacterium CG_4_9_14_3_um_filter_49_83]|nr:MAG: hypothetical protein COW62_11925 [Zetaproteobacteria bacterium CG17_big_fil_post_rev_8_21_14_2_50_50_13]PIV29665.1 MAG: hypothetical protein COS35_10810 [Zetaproteobacteria bacterium CG02_land_8_20_14_3_00_50_9]PIY56306.1 MAG: hypothetical protein COZ00_04865 [Zetaproteobacteria bacterium CG_4_10_14_0_8_um_filter_49_80]PJA35390.1 MAG: hypothetical protein CO186_06095 [Zetaproteobacteria bacterium CG_4_9_14_3_um_filter_49_83]
MIIATQILGSISDSSTTVECIDTLLKQAVKELSHGGDFTGKPVTRIHVSATHVLKMHLGGGFHEQKTAALWCEKHLAKNKAVDLYHPQKTWFITKDEDVWRVGNITPRMQPLHTLLNECDNKQSLEWLVKVCALYIRHAAKFQERLDEGLSNFGLADDGKLYYLDDDFYSWDHFLSFTAMLAGWFRLYSPRWLNEDAAYYFSGRLAEIILDRFHCITDMAPLHTVFEHMGDHYLNGAALISVDRFRKALLESSHIKSSFMPLNDEKVLKMHAVEDLNNWLEEDKPIALLADIHANFPALKAVLAEVKKDGVQRILSLGDVVGYGPHPIECIELLSELDAVCIRGNHDQMVGSGVPVPSMHGSRLIAAEWTVNQLAVQHKRWLLDLPLQWRNSPWIVMHGAPVDATFFNAYIYDRTAESNLNWMEEHRFSFCIHGHSHLQTIYARFCGNTRQMKGPQNTTLENISLICPGSVGQPRGGVAGAEFAVLYPLSRRVIMKIIDYDIESTIRDMCAYQLPDQLVQRLRNGQ